MLLGVKGRARKKLERLRDALRQGLPEIAEPLLKLLRGQWRQTEGALLELERRIFETAKRDWKEPWRLLQTLPGTGPLEAEALLAEIGDDMERFG